MQVGVFYASYLYSVPPPPVFMPRGGGTVCVCSCMTGVYSVTQVSFELSLPQPHKYWDYRHELPCSLTGVAGFLHKPRSQSVRFFRGSRFQNLIFESGLNRIS